jgi:hypothetical protein
MNGVQAPFMPDSFESSEKPGLKMTGVGEKGSPVSKHRSDPEQCRQTEMKKDVLSSDDAEEGDNVQVTGWIPADDAPYSRLTQLKLRIRVEADPKRRGIGEKE